MREKIGNASCYLMASSDQD